MNVHLGKLDQTFISISRSLYTNPVKSILVILLTIGSIVSQLPKLIIDTKNESFFHENSEILNNYNEFRDLYGREDFFIISVTPPKLFDIAFLLKLKAFHNDLEANVPHLDEVNSLINARNTRGEETELVVEDLFETWPKNDQQLALIQERALKNPLYRNTFLTEDGLSTAVIVETSVYSEQVIDEANIYDEFVETNEENTAKSILSMEQNAEALAAVLEISDKHNSSSFPITVAGSPVFTSEIKEMMKTDLAKFTVAAILIFAVILYTLFRSAAGVIIPISTAIIASTSTLGILAATGTSIKMQTQILPTFTLAVSIACSVHIIAMFYKSFNESGEKEQSIDNAIGHSALPVLMSCVTTAAGMMSFSNANVAPIADLGIFSGVGIFFALFYSITLTPILLKILPVKQRIEKKRQADFIERILQLFSSSAINHPKRILISTILLSLIAITGVNQLSFYANGLEWLAPSNAVRIASESLDEKYKGSMTLEMVIDTHRENGLYDPELLNALERLTTKIQEIKIGNIKSYKIVSIIDIIKEINMALNEGDDKFYTIPQDEQLVAQELFLFENTGSDDLEKLVDSQFRKARFTIRYPWTDGVITEQYSQTIQTLFEQELPHGVTVYHTGFGPMMGKVVVDTLESLYQSYIVAALVITFLMALFIGNIKLGLIAMFPNIVPIFITMGMMGALGFPLDPFTMFIGTIAIGISVDDTIHFIHGFNRFYKLNGNIDEAIKNTMKTSGRALLVTTLVLSAAFFSYTFSGLLSISRFGMITGTAIVFALLCDFLLTPALLKLALTSNAAESTINQEQKNYNV